MRGARIHLFAGLRGLPFIPSVGGGRGSFPAASEAGNSRRAVSVFCGAPKGVK